MAKIWTTETAGNELLEGFITQVRTELRARVLAAVEADIDAAVDEAVASLKTTLHAHRDFVRGALVVNVLLKRDGLSERGA